MSLRKRNTPPFTPAVSVEMELAMEQWKAAFFGDPSWNAPGMRLSGLPAALTGYVATLVTNEMSLSFGDSPRGKAMERMFRPLTGMLHRAVQLAAVYGYVVLRPMVWEGQVIFLLAEPGRFWPTEFAPDGSIIGGYFLDWVGTYLKTEEFQLKNRTLTIRNRAFRVKNGSFGEEVPLDSCPELKALSPETVLEGMDQPLMGVIRMPFLNSVDPGNPMPESLYAGAMASMEEFDRVYSELLYELHSGKRKNIVERGAIVPESRQKRIRGAKYFDPTTDTYILDPAEEHSPFQDYSPSLRTGDYLTGMKAVLHIIENQCHLSPGSLALDDRTGAMTATEVISQDRTTYNTCAAIQNRGAAPGLRQLARAAEILGDLYGLLPSGETEMQITWGDSIFEDTQKEFERRMELLREGVVGKEEVKAWYFGEG